jgi:hypothetical protein
MLNKNTTPPGTSTLAPLASLSPTPLVIPPTVSSEILQAHQTLTGFSEDKRNIIYMCI